MPAAESIPDCLNFCVWSTVCFVKSFPQNFTIPYKNCSDQRIRADGTSSLPGEINAELHQTLVGEVRRPFCTRDILTMFACSPSLPRPP